MQRQLSLLVFVLLTVGVPAHASDWYPIDTGRSWSYSGTGGSTSSATIDAPAVFAGALAQPLHWNANVLEWMSQDGSGRVYEHGLTYPDGSYVVFDPPMLRMDSDLTPGHQWETTFDRITYNVVGAEVGRVTAHFVYEVKGVGAVNVPAAAFQGVDVQITRSQTGVPDYVFDEWYVEGVGFVLRTDTTGIVFQLTAYGPLLATQGVSWGAVKAMYR